MPGNLRHAVIRFTALSRPGFCHPTKVAPGGTLISHVAGELVARHGCQQPEQLVGRVQFKLPERGPDEEARHHRLADIHRIEHAIHSGVEEAQHALLRRIAGS